MPDMLHTLGRRGGPDTILGNSHVVRYDELKDPRTGASRAVSVTLEDGRVFTGDVLVGADGIRSKVRKQMVGETEPNYSEYTCYTGISDFTPADINVVGYRVFLGSAQYFVSSDVGGGKMQWYGFHKEPAGGKDAEGTRKARLLQIFGGWSDNVVDLIKATPEEDILRRDIYDRRPIFQWHEGRTVLLGDAVHAMQPNLGQGGCMAIEDAYELANDLTEAWDRVGGDASQFDSQAAFAKYQGSRMLRASTIHGMAGMAAFMASTYKVRGSVCGKGRMVCCLVASVGEMVLSPPCFCHPTGIPRGRIAHAPVHAEPVQDPSPRSRGRPDSHEIDHACCAWMGAWGKRAQH